MSSSDLDRPSRLVSRRRFLRASAFASGGLTLLVACGPQAPAGAPAKDPAPAQQAPAQKPAEAPKSAAPAAKPADTKPAAGADAPKKGGNLRVGFYIEAATMDPHLSGSKIDRQVYHNMYEPLVIIDNKLQIKPGLAESWEIPEPKTVVFKLRKGVKFHDGTDFNAEAAKFNFERMATEPKSVRKGEIASIDSAQVVDEHTLKLNLKRPDSALLATLTDRAGMMISPKVVRERGPDLERNAAGAGTGPFEFVEWVKDDHLTLKRNENYWDKQGGPYLDQIRYRPIPDDTVKLQSAQAGEIDVMDYVQPRDVAAVKADQSLVEVDVPSLASFWYQINTVKPPFDNKALRQAVALAVDTEQIVKGVWLGVGVPSNGPISPSSWAYDDAIKPIKRDLVKAKEKLAEGGMPNGLTFSLTTNNIPINVQEAEVIKAQLAEAGITMNINLVDSARLLADGNAKNFDLISYQWSGRPDPDGNTYQFFHTVQGTSLNWSSFSNTKADELLDKTREVSDQAERKKLYSEFIKILHEEMPALFIVHPIEPKAFSPKVQGYDPVPDGMMRFKDVWLK
jgi:peptide/nickel transport system substrate-binding protein